MKKILTFAVRVCSICLVLSGLFQWSQTFVPWNLFQNLPSAWWDKWAKVYSKRQHICWAQSKLLRKYSLELSSSNVLVCWVHFRSLLSSGRRQILKQIRILQSLTQKIWTKIQNEVLLTTFPFFHDITEPSCFYVSELFLLWISLW